MPDITKIVSNYPRRVAVLLLMAIVAAIFIAGAQPFAVNLIPAPWDKFAHTGIFFLICVAIGVASGLAGARMLVVALAGAVLLGMLDEWHQGFLPGRNAGLDDLAADVLGAMIGVAVLVVRQRLRRPAPVSH